jgi:hypothetical protein
VTSSVWKVIRAMARLEDGRDCRDCGEAIHAGDPFGMSEAVCRACRREADA